MIQKNHRGGDADFIDNNDPENFEKQKLNRH
jgi:hypothetical protein